MQTNHAFFGQLIGVPVLYAKLPICPARAAVIALSADNTKLLLFDESTQKWRQLTEKMGALGYMTWSRDSKYVGFDRSFNADPAFSSDKHSGGTDHARDKPKEYAPIFPAIYGRMERGMTPDGSPLVVRDISTQEIYALDWKF